jgi:WhiB family transcriptional regulator, redox-sensing transcriptional regulator
MYLQGTATVVDDDVLGQTVAVGADVERLHAIAGGPGSLAVLPFPGATGLGLVLPCTSDPDLFFAESPDDVELAKSLCRGCAVRSSCLAGAVQRREPWGVWGGELFLRGEIVPRKRPRGRPRKTDVAA